MSRLKKVLQMDEFLAKVRGGNKARLRTHWLCITRHCKRHFNRVPWLEGGISEEAWSEPVYAEDSSDIYPGCFRVIVSYWWYK